VVVERRVVRWRQKSEMRITRPSDFPEPDLNGIVDACAVTCELFAPVSRIRIFWEVFGGAKGISRKEWRIARAKPPSRPFSGLPTIRSERECFPQRRTLGEWARWHVYAFRKRAKRINYWTLFQGHVLVGKPVPRA
jgi:hypothetical protein